MGNLPENSWYIDVFQWDMFGIASLLAADCACCDALGLDKQVRYLASSRLKEDPFSRSGEGWSFGDNFSLTSGRHFL